MAYTSTITKLQPQKTDKGIVISVNVVVEEDAIEVFNQSFSKRHNPGNPLGDIKTVLQNKIKIAWDKYITEKNTFELVGFDTLCTDLSTSLDTYSNT